MKRDIMEAKLRRYRSSLVTNGIGIITFGLWSLIKIYYVYGGAAGRI